MQNENIKETVSEEAVNTEQKIYVVTEPSYFDGMFHNSGEIIRTDKKPSLYMKKITESPIKANSEHIIILNHRHNRRKRICISWKTSSSTIPPQTKKRIIYIIK